MTPKLIAIPFGRDGNKNIIYETRQQGQADNEATWATGFPPITMQSKTDGGLPPLGLDFNGIFHDISENTVYQCMGGQYYFNAKYAEKIGGYPKGAILLNNENDKQYISLIDNNKGNFNIKEDGWAVISIAGIDGLLAGKVSNTDLSNSLNLKADKDRQIIAGDGLTGGGTLEQNRTLTLGAPAKISATSKNEVTTNSHSHAIDQASLTQKGITQLTSTLSDREDLSVTPKALNDVNRKAVNAEKIGVNADTKAVAAQKTADEAKTKANQVPNPIKDRFLVGNTTTAYKLMTVDQVRDLLKITDEVPVPVGQIFIFHTKDGEPPSGYIARNGQAIDKAKMPKLFAEYGANMPDDRNRYYRNQGDLTGAVGTTQEDAIRNIIGEVQGGNAQVSTGAFSFVRNSGEQSGTGFPQKLFKFDASKVVPTASENRVKSRIIIACNKIQ